MNKSAYRHVSLDITAWYYYYSSGRHVTCGLYRLL